MPEGDAMQITKTQFVRGMTAILDFQDMKDAIHREFAKANLTDAGCLGGENLVDELVQQLEERCGDPHTHRQCSAIRFFLWENRPETEWRLPDGALFDVRFSEHLWDYWERSKTGPFSHP